MPTSLIARARKPAIALAAAATILASLVPTVAAASVTISTPYPRIAVAPGSKASFDLTVTADVDGTINLVVLGAPTGWKATLHGGGFVVQGVNVDGVEARHRAPRRRHPGGHDRHERQPPGRGLVRRCRQVDPARSRSSSTRTSPATSRSPPRRRR